MNDFDGRRAWRSTQTGCVLGVHQGRPLKPLVHQIETAGGLAHPFACDTRNEDQVIKLVDQIEREVAPIEVAVFNVGANFLLRNCRTLN
jgi:NAD(P)-dependent dehydrogenase (short-subunit alcohol dehydrogenase family)